MRAPAAEQRNAGCVCLNVIDPTDPVRPLGRKRGGQPWMRRPMIFYGWIVVLAAFTAQFVAVGVQTSVSAVFAPVMIEEFGWTRSQFFAADTLGQVILVLVGLYLGPRVDRFGSRPIMLLGVAICVPALALMSQVDSWWEFIVVRGVFVLTGAAMAGFLVASVTVSKWFVTKRGQALGWTSMGVSAAGVVWPTLTQHAFIEPLGWRTTWIILAAIALAVLVPASMAMRRRPEDYGMKPDGDDASTSQAQQDSADHDYHTSLTRPEAVRTSAFYLIVLTFGISVVGIFAILLHGVLFLGEHGFKAGLAAILVAVMSILSAVTKPPWGWALDRFDSRAVGAVSFAIAAAGFVFVVLAADTGSAWLVGAAFALMGLGIGGNIPIQEMIWAEYFGRRYLGAVRSLGFPVAMGISAATPLAVAIYADLVGSYDGAFYTCAGLWAASALMCLLLRLPSKRRGRWAVRRLVAETMAAVARSGEQKRGW